MVEEVLVSGAEVVEAVLAVGRGYEAIAWAAAMTGEPDLTVPAILRECVAFCVSERSLFV